MRETMKNLIKNTITSIGIALTVFCVTGMVSVSYTHLTLPTIA